MNSAEVLIKFKGDTSDIDKKANDVKSSVGSKIGSVASGIGKAFLKGTAVAGAAMAGMVAKGVSEYAKLEQSIGGVETLFKESADTVIANAKKAYETAGVDANQYMEQVTSFSASLLQATGGDTVKAANTADMAIRDMADNANKMGTSMEMIQNAYQGFAKQNYMMLDNLKLGYGGTKTEMQRLLADAQKITGIKYDISNLNDVYSAIHVIQGELGITGTTAKEAASTIQGSASSMKAAFTNFLSGAGGIDEVITTVETFATNVVNAIIKLAPKIVNGLVKLVNVLITKLPALIQSLLPSIVNGVVQLVQGIVNVLPTLLSMLASMLPKILNSLIKGLIQIIKSLAQQLPKIIPMLIKAIIGLIPVLLENIPLFIDAGIQLIIGLANGLLDAIPVIVEMLPEIIDSLITALLESMPQLMLAGVQLIIGLSKGLIKAVGYLIAATPQIIKGIVNGLKHGLSAMVNVGKNLVMGLWNGIKDLKDWVIKKVKALGGSIVKSLKNALGIHSPSTEFAMIGRFSVLGYTEALDKMQKDVENQVASTFGLSPQLTGSMQNSFSPNVQVYNNINVEQDPLGQMVSNIKTFGSGAKNDYNYGSGI